MRSLAIFLVLFGAVLTGYPQRHIAGGSGSCTIATNGVIQGRISGSGGINYKGDPSSVDVTHSGSGRAHKID